MISVDSAHHSLSRSLTAFFASLILLGCRPQSEDNPMPVLIETGPQNRWSVSVQVCKGERIASFDLSWRSSEISTRWADLPKRGERTAQLRVSRKTILSGGFNPSEVSVTDRNGSTKVMNPADPHVFLSTSSGFAEWDMRRVAHPGTAWLVKGRSAPQPAEASAPELAKWCSNDHK